MARPAFGPAAALASSMLLASQAPATPIPRYEDLVTKPSAPSALPLAFATSAPPYKSTKITAIDTKIGLNPLTGELTGQASLGISAIAQVGLVWVLLDGGLTVTAATAPGKSVAVDSQSVSGYTYATLTITPPLAPGESVSVAFDYSGKLQCGGQNCKTGAPLAYLAEGSAMPSVVDQDQIGGLNAWGASRTLEVRVPKGMDVVASGDQVSATEVGTESVTVWKIPGYHSYGGNVVMIGELLATPVSGVAPSTAVWAVGEAQAFVPQMADWMKKILPFVDAQAGKPLPYAALKVFKLPLGWLDIFRGTAGYGLTLLSEDYGASSASYFEETLAHENVHQWWGVLVSPTDALYTRWLVEGLATQAQIEYAAEHQANGLEREEYLARRYREHWMLVRYLGDPSLPLVVKSPSQIPEAPIPNTLWAYIRSSAFLEHLRVLFGDAVYAKTLKQWAAQCAQVNCDSADFLNIAEQTSGKKLTELFAQHVYEGTAVEPRLSFEQGAGSKAKVTAQGIEGLSVPLELFVTLENGKLEKRQVTFQGSSPVELDITEPVRSVRPNPRHDGFVWSRSAVTGDLDFDNQVDGFDVIHCAWRLGKTTEPSQVGGEGIWSSDLDFDPRCDADGDGTIGEADLKEVTSRFGTLGGGL